MYVENIGANYEKEFNRMKTQKYVIVVFSVLYIMLFSTVAVNAMGTGKAILLLGILNNINSGEEEDALADDDGYLNNTEREKVEKVERYTLALAQGNLQVAADLSRELERWYDTDMEKLNEEIRQKYKTVSDEEKLKEVTALQARYKQFKDEEKYYTEEQRNESNRDLRYYCRKQAYSAGDSAEYTMKKIKKIQRELDNNIENPYTDSMTKLRQPKSEVAKLKQIQVHKQRIVQLKRDKESYESLIEETSDRDIQRSFRRKCHDLRSDIIDNEQAIAKIKETLNKETYW